VDQKGKYSIFLSSAYMQHVRSWPTDPSNVVDGELAPGWHVEVKTRNSGTSAGTSDAVSLPALRHLSHMHCIHPIPVPVVVQHSCMLLCMTAKPHAAASVVPSH